MENEKLLEKIIGYIEANEKMRETMFQVMTGSSLKKERKEISAEDKIRAAYALNMCTVSVSQIVDYKDLNILEQEYDAILNNLNLEQMPKDDALLHILKQLLDTITYFRIEEGEKQMIERDYQQKMKNAIWDSVPQFGLLVAGGNPITMAISLASQVGIGYMNYRRNKAANEAEKENRMWQLQKTAIEQFNGLRRELFDTAWRLADAYQFPDGYRLTEKQITQYNKILMDQDEIRKYERLDSIKEKFEAYPPFWYFIGNAANYIAGNNDLDLSEETRGFYRKKALAYFEKFEDLNKFNLLREDQLVAACALEHIDLLLLEEKPDTRKINKLLSLAFDMSGNANDILELCAITYLKIGEQNKAAKVLKILVNEDYNRIINAQLLSSIYVHTKNRADYELLATRVAADYLYPMPVSDEADVSQLEYEFGSKQKMVLKQKYQIVIQNYLDKYSIEWNKITSEFETTVDYPDSFFLNTEKARADRQALVRRLYANRNKWDHYQRRIANANYELNLLCILNELSSRLFASKAFADSALQQKVEKIIEGQIAEKRDDINEIQKVMTEGNFTESVYLASQKITLESIVGVAFKEIYEYADKQVTEANMNQIMNLEGSLEEFCVANDLKQPEIAINHTFKDKKNTGKKQEPFGPELFGRQAVVAKKNADSMAGVLEYVKDRLGSENLVVIGDGVAVLLKDSAGFSGYFMNMAFENYPDMKSHSVMILKDHTNKKFDLIFTTDGIVNVVRDRVGNLTPYDEVKVKSDSIVLYKKEYKNASVDVNRLFNLICGMGKRFHHSIDEKIEYVYIKDTITSRLLNKWFREKKEAMAEGSVCIYAIPTKDLLEHLHYQPKEKVDDDKHLLQYYYDKQSGELIEMRIIKFDNIESNFQAYLIEHDGFIKVTK